MEQYEPYLSLGLALAAGLLFGFEREQSRPASADESFLGGARTYPLIALTGAVAMLLSRALGVTVVLVVMAGVVALLAISYVDDVRSGRARGITSEAALLLTFLLGALSASDVVQPAERKVFVVSSVAVIATLLLSIKPALHSLLKKASKEDVFATLKFLLVAVVVLPLLPNQTYGPLEVLNPFQIGLMVVLIAGVSFTGYLTIRLMGARRGLGLTGLVGGLVSSTAVTLSFSGRARETPELASSCALAIALASSIMFVRVLVLVAVVSPALMPQVAMPIGLMAAAGFVGSFFLWRHSQKRASVQDIAFANPFELSSAVKFAGLFALVLLGAKAATSFFGASGTYLAGVLAGLTDVDAITLSMGNLANGGLSAAVAATTIYLATVSNTLVKGGMSGFVGGARLARHVWPVFGAITLAGLAGVAILWTSR